jgi:hypothetical protein
MLRAQLTAILQANRVTRQFFPPKGNTAVILTLILGIVSIFLVFRSLRSLIYNLEWADF